MILNFGIGSTMRSNHEYRAVLKALRGIMKNRKVNYRNVANALKVSEPTIKRFFSGEDSSFNRIVEICGVLEVEVFDVFALAAEKREHTFSMRLEDEEFFAKHPEHYALLDSLMNKYSLSTIKSRFHLDEAKLSRALRALEQRGFIERLPQEKVKVKVSGAHHWIPGGPLQKRLMLEGFSHFLTQLSSLTGPNFPTQDHLFTGSETRVRRETLLQYKRLLDELFISFRKQAQSDDALFASAELIEIKWLAALAPWPDPFARYLEPLTESTRR